VLRLGTELKADDVERLAALDSANSGRKVTAGTRRRPTWAAGRCQGKFPRAAFVRSDGYVNYLDRV